jgi:23S rRNA G2445 N2-methylase RlmL
MSRDNHHAAKDLYKKLRLLPWSRIWDDEVPRFDRASSEEQEKNVAVIRAVGVVYAESGPPQEKNKVRDWILGFLQNPNVRIRRYAMAALPKIGVGESEEAKLLAALESTTDASEKKSLVETLSKIGGRATLQQGSLGESEQKIKAGVAREENPSALRFHATLTDVEGAQIRLRGRHGLERIVGEEAEQSAKFRVSQVEPGQVIIVPRGPFSLADIYTLRCFGTVGLFLGMTTTDDTDALASIITSPLALRLLRTFTEGSIRYRLNFVNKGHQRAAIARLAGRVYALRPEILNDGRSVTWTIDIYPTGVELRPNVTPDPRFSYRQHDVPAASHPPLAACLARLAGKVENETVWDPFCGSGLELIERALLGGVRAVYGTDRSPEAIRIAQTNFAAAHTDSIDVKFICGDFREAQCQSATLIITNPPLGMRVPVPNLRQLIEDLFRIAAQVLKPGGRLVLINPLSKFALPASLKLQFQQTVDLGGFNCRMEKYVKGGANT